MVDSPSGVPGLDRLQRSNNRLRWALLVVALGGVGAALWAGLVIRDQSETLAKRTPAIVYLELLGEQQACVDRFEAEHDIAIGNVVLAAVLPPPVPGAPPPPQPEDFAGDVREAVRNLERLDFDLDTNDPADVLCQIPQPPPPLTEEEARGLRAAYLFALATTELQGDP